MNAESSGSSRLRIFFQFAVVTLIWGSTWLAIRDQLGTVPPTWSVVYRFVIAAAVMFGWVVVARLEWRLSPKGHLIALAVGLTQFMLNFNFVYRAEAFVTSGVVALAYALLLVPNAVLAFLFLGQKITARFTLGSAIAIAGVSFMFVHEFEESTVSPALLTYGLILTGLGVFVASIANVLQATSAARQQPLISLLGHAMFYGAVLNAIYALLFIGGPVFDSRPGYWAGVLFLAIMGSVVTFPLYARLLREIGPARAAYTGILVPVVAMIFSTIFEGYRWTGLSIGGVALATFGLLIALNARKPSRKSE